VGIQQAHDRRVPELTETRDMALIIRRGYGQRIVPRQHGDRGPTRKAYEEYLDALGIPEDDRASNAGRIPDRVTKYGHWLRHNDPVAFNVGYNEWRDQT
jgi:hypothetical protein